MRSKSTLRKEPKVKKIKEVKVDKPVKEAKEVEVSDLKVGDKVTTPMGAGVVTDVMYIMDGSVLKEKVAGCDVKVVVNVDGVNRTYEERDIS